MSLTAKKLITCLFLSIIILGEMNPIFGQAALQQPPGGMVMRPQPPMKNVFLNVLWGSVNGGMLLMGWSTLDDSISSDERFKFSRLSEQFLIGATYGGILGMAAGVYFSIRGITFDESRSRIAFYPDYDKNPDGQRFFASSGAVRDKKSINLVNLHFKF
ncbi:hypothetical protein KKI24_02135 [bacterium]|nr:hypothetical protein [bacterium]